MESKCRNGKNPPPVLADDAIRVRRWSQGELERNPIAARLKALGLTKKQITTHLNGGHSRYQPGAAERDRWE
jgi:hypothetical protein